MKRFNGSINNIHINSDFEGTYRYEIIQADTETNTQTYAIYIRSTPQLKKSKRIHGKKIEIELLNYATEHENYTYRPYEIIINDSCQISVRLAYGY